MNAGKSQEEAQSPTHYSQEDRLRKELLPQTGSVGSHGQPSRQLPHSCIGPRKHQIGDVHAPDEEDEPHASPEHEE